MAVLLGSFVVLGLRTAAAGPWGAGLCRRRLGVGLSDRHPTGRRPAGALVLGAAANTNPRESGEYLSMHWRTALLWSAALLAAAVGSWRLATQGRRAGATRLPRWVAAGIALVLLAGAVGYASKPWLKTAGAARKGRAQDHRRPCGLRMPNFMASTHRSSSARWR